MEREPNPLVSIIMTTRNSAAFLCETLDSIIAQSYENWELIVTNNQSTDNTQNLLDKYGMLDQRIISIHNPGNPEIIDGLQLSFSHSKGTLVTRMDSDDLMPSNKIEKLVYLLVTQGRGHLVTGKICHFSDDQILDGFKRYDEWLNNLVDNANNYEDIYKECVIPSSCWMVYRDDFIECGAFGRKVYPEDYDLCFRFYEKELKIVTVKEVMHLWRDHPRRISRTDARYADQLYFDLKLYYFLRIDYDPKQKIILWGAGKKGKRLAKHLIQLNINFSWVCNNKNKIGHKIYGVELLPISFIHQKEFYLIMIAVTSRDTDSMMTTIKSSKHKFLQFC